MNHSEQINELAAALSKAQGEITGAIRDSTNPHFRSKYADLSSVWEGIRRPFSANGLSVVQGLSSSEAGVNCETMLLHASGQWISSSLTIPADKINAHGFGSAATYARRFGLQAIAGIAPIDDDGNAAVESVPAISPVRDSLGDWPAQHPEEMESLKELAADLVDAVEKGESKIAYLRMVEQKLDSDQKTALWSLLAPNSKTRAALKKEAEAAKK
jgi:hypothetical protein